MSDDRITSLVKSSEEFWSEIASNVGLVGRIHTIKPEGRVPKFEISIASNGDLTAVNLGVKNSEVYSGGGFLLVGLLCGFAPERW